MYDIASLTKVAGTTTITEKLFEGDFPVPLDLDAKVERYLPEWISSGSQAGVAASRDGAAFAHAPLQDCRHSRNIGGHRKASKDTLDRIFAEAAGI